MQREWKASREPQADEASWLPSDHEVSVTVDASIIRSYRERWPNNWREKMAEVITAAASKL